MPDRSSPLDASMNRGLRFIGALLWALALVLGLAAVLVWTIDEQARAPERGALLLGLAVLALLGGLGLWRAGRPGPPLAVVDAPPPTRWRRTRLGPAWYSRRYRDGYRRRII